MATIALLGAGGSMGTRVVRALKGDRDYRLLCVEPSDAGRARLRNAGITPLLVEQAAKEADAIILAVPDALMSQVAGDVVPSLRSGTLVICLDPAAPHAGKLPLRKDISHFVTHPAHPPVFNDETDPEARRDFFGSGKAKQALVCALLQGPEEDYLRGETIARRIFGPILRAHRITVEQMAMLEPGLSETVAATCLTVIREAMDEVIRRGVPPEAARDFLMGHLNIELAIVFGEIDWHFSAGAMKAIEEAKKRIFQPAWKSVLEPESIRETVAKITGEEAV